ncbi:Isoleucine--tRNA ligase, cytoplasmic [Arachis hypogaea]|nr:Isoleucine--tRNA ligase, cytoplasmic [Arachis hypogaea]
MVQEGLFFLLQTAAEISKILLVESYYLSTVSQASLSLLPTSVVSKVPRNSQDRSSPTSVTCCWQLLRLNLQQHSLLEEANMKQIVQLTGMHHDICLWNMRLLIPILRLTINHNGALNVLYMAPEIIIIRDFKQPDGTTKEEIDSARDGDILVILDLRPDESFFEAGAAREIVNRIQKLRKKISLEPSDMVEVYFESLDQDKSLSQRVLHSQESYIRDAIGSQLLSYHLKPAHAVILDEERFDGISGMSFGIILARLALMFNSKAILSLFEGDANYAHNLETHLLSRENSDLKYEFRNGNGKIMVDCIEEQPTSEVVFGLHVFLTVGDCYVAGKDDKVGFTRGLKMSRV